MSNNKECPACADKIKEAAIVCKHCKVKLMKCASCDEWTDASRNKCLICESEISAPIANTMKARSGPVYWLYILYALPMGFINGLIHSLILKPSFFFKIHGVDYTHDPVLEEIFDYRVSTAVILYPLIVLSWGIIIRKISANEKPYAIIKKHFIGLSPIFIMSYAIWGEINIEVANFISFAIVGSILMAFPNKLHITVLATLFAAILSNSIWFLYDGLSDLDNIYLSFKLFLLDWRTFFLLLVPVLFYQQIAKHYEAEDLPVFQKFSLFFKNDLNIHPKIFKLN